MAKPSGPRRSAPEVELCIPVIDEDSTKGRRISMMISKHLVTDAPKTTLGPIGRTGDDLHDVNQALEVAPGVHRARSKYVGRADAIYDYSSNLVNLSRYQTLIIQKRTSSGI